MKKLFGFVRSQSGQPARLVRVEASGRIPKEELRRKLMAISSRKQRAYAAVHATGKGQRDEQPPSNSRQTLHEPKGRRDLSQAALFQLRDCRLPYLVNSATRSFAS